MIVFLLLEDWWKVKLYSGCGEEAGAPADPAVVTQLQRGTSPLHQAHRAREVGQRTRGIFSMCMALTQGDSPDRLPRSSVG